MPLFPAMPFRRRDRARLDALERAAKRLIHDVERLRGGTTLVLGPDRAVTELASGYRLYIDPRDRGSGINLALDGRIEEDELRVLRRFLRPGAVFLDIGANYGYYSVSAAPYLRPGGRAIGFEPNPHVHDLFAASVYVNGLTDVIEARQLGVSDRRAAMRLAIDERGPGGARVVPPGSPVDPGLRAVDVTTVALDEHLAPDLVVDVAKIDVEGHEAQVLRGMRGVIARSPGIAILIEYIHDFFPDEVAAARFADLVTGELGLHVARIVPGGGLVATDFAALRGASCNLLLSRRAIAPMPDLVLRPAQLHRVPEARLAEGALHWRAAGGGPERTHAITQGPHVFLPRGRYRVRLDGTFAGRVLFRVQENYGALLAEAVVRDGADAAIEVDLPWDVPKLDVALLATAGKARAATLRAVEFWPR